MGLFNFFKREKIDYDNMTPEQLRKMLRSTPFCILEFDEDLSDEQIEQLKEMVEKRRRELREEKENGEK